MLKLVGAVLIIFASAGLGYLKSRELMLHEKNLEEFLQVILCLKGEIRCGNRLNLEKGEADIEGEIDMITYSKVPEVTGKKDKMFGRIFR